MRVCWTERYVLKSNYLAWTNLHMHQGFQPFERYAPNLKADYSGRNHGILPHGILRPNQSTFLIFVISGYIKMSRYQRHELTPLHTSL